MSENHQPRQAQLGTYVTMIVGLLFLFLIASQAGKYQHDGLVVTKVNEKLALRDERQKTLMKIGAEPVSANYIGINLPPVVMQAGGKPGAANPAGTPAGNASAQAAANASGTGQTAAAPAVDNEPRVYVVRPGETLFVISQKVYGDGNRWREILRANPELPAPNKLSNGMRLKIPVPEQSTAAYRRWVAQAGQPQDEATAAPAAGNTAASGTGSRNVSRRRN